MLPPIPSGGREPVYNEEPRWRDRWWAMFMPCNLMPRLSLKAEAQHCGSPDRAGWLANDHVGIEDRGQARCLCVCVPTSIVGGIGTCTIKLCCSLYYLLVFSFLTTFLILLLITHRISLSLLVIYLIVTAYHGSRQGKAWHPLAHDRRRSSRNRSQTPPAIAHQQVVPLDQLGP